MKFEATQPPSFFFLHLLCLLIVPIIWHVAIFLKLIYGRAGKHLTWRINSIFQIIFFEPSAKILQGNKLKSPLFKIYTRVWFWVRNLISCSISLLWLYIKLKMMHSISLSFLKNKMYLKISVEKYERLKNCGVVAGGDWEWLCC